ncbi:hypothetical protein [uncultured Paraglaciecola sp.]|uniref:hypothetical protein n=1 Tax=uncultured Paraglaciecola sp. TaxID=1765024 RepID=UPI0026396CBE|nr:hypothetical protein [uncultured Paraglaciecola sp.]
MRTLNLPEWASLICKGKVDLDADGMYKDWLGRLNVTKDDLNVYWLECAKICARLEIQLALAGTDSVADEGGALLLIINDNSKTKNTWKQKSRSTKSVNATPEEAISQDLIDAGKEANGHFKRVMQINI